MPFSYHSKGKMSVFRTKVFLLVFGILDLSFAIPSSATFLILGPCPLVKLFQNPILCTGTVSLKTGPPLPHHPTPPPLEEALVNASLGTTVHLSSVWTILYF